MSSPLVSVRKGSWQNRELTSDGSDEETPIKELLQSKVRE